eukprot:660109-Ditylum_brightwellii.AAC.1
MGTKFTVLMEVLMMERKKQNAYGLNAAKSRSLLYDSAISNEGKEVDDGVDDYNDNHFNGCVDGHDDCCVNVAKEGGANGSFGYAKSRIVMNDSAISNEGKEVNGGIDD